MGFVAIYRWEVQPGHEAGFRERWRAATLRLRELGSLGSCLTCDPNGEFVAIALWPSERARDEAFGKIETGQPASGTRLLGEWALEVEDDLWVGSPFGAE